MRDMEHPYGGVKVAGEARTISDDVESLLTGMRSDDGMVPIPMLVAKKLLDQLGYDRPTLSFDTVAQYVEAILHVVEHDRTVWRKRGFRLSDPLVTILTGGRNLIILSGERLRYEIELALHSIEGDGIPWLFPNNGMKEPQPELIMKLIDRKLFVGFSALRSCIAELVATEEAAYGWNPNLQLYCSYTNDHLGQATEEQVEASFDAGPEGHIYIDADGDVVVPGWWSPKKSSFFHWEGARLVDFQGKELTTTEFSLLATLEGMRKVYVR